MDLKNELDSISKKIEIMKKKDIKTDKKVFSQTINDENPMNLNYKKEFPNHASISSPDGDSNCVSCIWKNDYSIISHRKSDDSGIILLKDNERNAVVFETPSFSSKIIDVSKNDNYFLSGTYTGMISLYDIRSGCLPVKMTSNPKKRHHCKVSGLGFYSDNHFVSCGVDGLLYYWDVYNMSTPFCKEFLSEDTMRNDKITVMSINRWQQIIFGTENGKLLTKSYGMNEVELSQYSSPITGIDTKLKTYDYICVSALAGDIELFEDMKSIYKDVNMSQIYLGCCFSPISDISIATFFENGCLSILNTNTKSKKIFTASSSPIACGSFNKTGNLLLTGHLDGTDKIIEIK